MEDMRNSLQEKIDAAKSAKKSNQPLNKTTIIKDVLIPILKKHNYNEDEIRNIIPTALALFIPDVLVDMNVTRLSKRAIPAAMKNSEFRKLISNGLEKLFRYNDDGKLSFFIGEKDKPIYATPSEIKKEEEAQISLRFLRSIIVSKYMKENPQLVPKDDDIQQWKNRVLEEQLAYLYSVLTGIIPPNVDLSKINPKINLEDNQVFAYLIPAILDRMNDIDLKTASMLIAEHLDITDFKPIALKKYFQPEIKMAEEAVFMSNQNKRSFQLFANAEKKGSSNSTLKLRDKVYKFQHTHIHFERDKEEKEYQVKGKDGKLLEFDGEVHNVFEYILEKDKEQAVPRKRLIAIGSPLKITNEINPDIQELLNSVHILEKEMDAVGNKKPENYFLHLQKKIDFGKIFMNSINNQDVNELIYHSWASLRSETHGFQSGLRFIISTKPITVSSAQYDELKELFGKMRTNLEENEILDPVDRKAGWRKERSALTQELKYLTEKTPRARL